jgi:hypothetical protein
MPKQFYTEKDIEDLFQRGMKSLQVTDDVVLTELAYEKAKRLGLQLVMDGDDNPPGAPVRPYLSDGGTAVHAQPKAGAVDTMLSQADSALTPALARGERERAIEQRIRAAVLAKLGDQVETKLLDNIIHRVVKGIGLK